MKANELRIGNLVYFEYQVVDINIGDFHIIEKESKFFKPIPLTEEWLLKFGFEDSKIVCGEYIMQVSVNSFSGTLTKDASWFISIVHVSAHQTITVVKQYVHQLQNLYFALTGKELSI